MARLPTPGSDEGTWGDVLNDYLSETHNADGTLKDASVPTPALQDGAVTDAKVATNISPAKISGLGASIASKADDAAVVHKSQAETISGTKNFTGGLTVAGANVVLDSDSRLTGSNSTSLADGSVTSAKLAASGGSNNELLMKDATQIGGLRWATIPTSPALVIAGSDTSSDLQATADYICSGINDHLVFNAAIAALPAAGGEIVAAGSFTFGDSVVIDRDYITIRGLGGAMLVRPATGLAVPLFNNTQPNGGYRLGLRYQQLQIDGQNITQTDGAVGICLTGCYYAVIEQCHIYGMRDAGISVVGSASAYGAYTSIRDCNVAHGTKRGISLGPNAEFTTVIGGSVDWHTTVNPGQANDIANPIDTIWGIGLYSASGNDRFIAVQCDSNRVNAYLAFASDCSFYGVSFDRAYENQVIVQGGGRNLFYGTHVGDYVGPQTNSWPAVNVTNDSSGNAWYGHRHSGANWQYAIAYGSQTGGNQGPNKIFGLIPETAPVLFGAGNEEVGLAAQGAVTTTATAGTAGAAPNEVVGYLTVTLPTGGTGKVPYYQQ